MIGQFIAQMSPRKEPMFDRMRAARNRVVEHTPGPNPQIGTSDWRADMDSIRECSVEGCHRTDRIVRGWCNTHYARFLRHGSVGGASIKRQSWDGALCAAVDCMRRPSADGLCMMHYKRRWRNGNLDLYQPQPIAAYMADRTAIASSPPERPGLGPCHEWTGTRLSNGYGVIGVRSHYKSLAHRVAFELARGPIPAGMVIDHLCRNRACVNPEHLEAVDNEENLRRGLGYRLRNGMTSSCIHGHEYTAENTYINPNNASDMRCRACARNRKKKRGAA